MPDYLQKTAFFILVSTILVVNLIRFYGLENAPRGFFIDEITSAVTAQRIATQGTDYTGAKWPLCGMIGFGSPKPPTQMYPLALWIKGFGISITSIRAFSACIYTLGLIGIFLLARLMAGGACAWLTLLAASISPWAWMFSRIGLESLLGPVFLVWGTFFFLLNTRLWSMALCGLFMAAAIYSYPPTAMHAPIVIFLLIGWRMKKEKLRPGPYAVFFVLLLLLLAPLIYYTIQGGPFVKHFNAKFIAYKVNSPFGVIALFIRNYLAHLSPQFLFLKGDDIYRYSTRHFGQLSWLDDLGLVAGLFLLVPWFKNRSKPSDLVVFLLMAVFSGILPSALTIDDIPNALRCLGSQPFVELLVGYCLAKSIERRPELMAVVSVTGMVFAACFLTVYFRIYPLESAEAFGEDIRIEAENCKTDSDWIRFLNHHPNDRILFNYYILRNYGKPASLWFF